MSNQGIVEHKANMYYVEFREDYLIICLSCAYKKREKSKASPYCQALILAISESWTNDKRGKGQDLFFYMTYPQWIEAMYGMFGRNVVIDSLDELIGEGLLSRERYRMYGKDTYKYLLNYAEVNRRIKALPERDPHNTRPLINAFTSKLDAFTSKLDTRLKVNGNAVTSKPNIESTKNHYTESSQESVSADSNVVDPQSEDDANASVTLPLFSGNDELALAVKTLLAYGYRVSHPASIQDTLLFEIQRPGMGYEDYGSTYFDTPENMIALAKELQASTPTGSVVDASHPTRKQKDLSALLKDVIFMSLTPFERSETIDLVEMTDYSVVMRQHEDGSPLFVVSSPDGQRIQQFPSAQFLAFVAHVKQHSNELSRRDISQEISNSQQLTGVDNLMVTIFTHPSNPPLRKDMPSIPTTPPVETTPLQASNSPVSEEVGKDTASTSNAPISASTPQEKAFSEDSVDETALSTSKQAVSHSQGTLRKADGTEASQNTLFEEQPAPTPAPTGKGAGKRTSKKQTPTEQKEAPKKPAKKATPERVKPEVEISPEGMIIWERWISFFKHKTTLSQMAADYAEKFVEIDPTPEDFKKLRIHLWDSNPGWYGRNGRKKGNITIKDAFNEWAGFVASLECPQEVPNNEGASSNGRRAQSGPAPRVISSFDDPNYDMSDEFYPTDAEKRAHHAAHQ